MQASATANFAGDREQAMIMERVIMEVRQHWFGARPVGFGHAVVLREGGGELVMCVDEESDGADRLIAAAAARGAYVVATTCSRPADLGARLRRAGFSCVQSHGTYVLDEAAFAAAAAEGPVRPERPGLLSLLWRRERPEVTVRRVTSDELPLWNAVCWRAFGSRVSEAASLLDKQTAFANMGGHARWYLATVGGRPAGTAIVYQGEAAAQVLAVGTLPSLQRRGVAGALMRHLCREWQQEGAGFLFLDTNPGSNAERLYFKLGFVKAYLREVYAPLRRPFLTED